MDIKTPRLTLSSVSVTSTSSIASTIEGTKDEVISSLDGPHFSHSY